MENYPSLYAPGGRLFHNFEKKVKKVSKKFFYVKILWYIYPIINN